MEIPSKVASLNNLRKVWRWIISNPDRIYKSYFRSLYSRYSINEEAHLESLHKRLVAGTYRPSHSCKLMLPKQSGILRPYSLLTVDDQIVYQAIVNVVAERLSKHTKAHTLKSNFGHLYAGKSSPWLYRRWSDGYSAMNKSARAAFKAGRVYSASFDLTACYDSLDHGVLSHFLRNLRFGPDFITSLTAMLSTWTATQSRIYQNHGIPQGPLSSGMLSEVVLHAFDRASAKSGITFLRYVDDIRLFASDESELRREIMRLDLLSKDIGLFPQAGKIGIHKIADIELELKQISSPVETSAQSKSTDQVQLRKRLNALSPRNKVQDATRFKYILGATAPHSQLNAKLIKIAKTRLDIFPSVMRYFRRYGYIPKRSAEAMLDWLESGILYPAMVAEIVETLGSHTSGIQMQRLLAFAKKAWKPASMDASTMSALGSLLVRHGALSPSSILYVLRQATDSWVICKLIECLGPTHFTGVFVQKALNERIRDKDADVSITAAYKLIELKLSVLPSQQRVHSSAHQLLKLFGLSPGRPASVCGIELSISEYCGRPTGTNWKKLFGATYKDAERQALLTFPLAKSNPSAFVNAAEVFDDWLVDALHRTDTSLGQYKLGNVSWAAKSTSNLAKHRPLIHQMVAAIHELRYSSPMSHPMMASTKMPSKPIRFSAIAAVKKTVLNALQDLRKAYPPA